jgi:hypothetical protein
MRNNSILHLMVVLGAALILAVVPTATASRMFFDDDPIAREPETQDASHAQGRDINLLFDLAMNLFTRQGDLADDVRARNINTIDEVPDSNWFTNRLLARTVSAEEAARGPLSGNGPAPGRWTIVAPKRSGDAPGFTVRDANNTLWFVSFDGRGHPEAATGAILVANKIFSTLGYWQIENYLTTVRPDALTIAESATIRPPSGHRRKMTRHDLDAILRRAHRSADGSYRAVAARAVEGRPIEGFHYFGTRSDDPNDVVPHEHRRELRALKVFGAWTNLVDMKAGNTLDTVVTENGRGVVRHYLQDVGSTFGTGANGPHDYFEGWEYLQEGSLTMKRLASFGFLLSPWQTVDYEYSEAIGRFEGDVFDPTTWKPRVPTAAFLHARADDNFWAARRVMAFSDDMIRAVAATGQYSDGAAAEHLARTLIKRRDAIGRAYLTAINPITDPLLDAGGVLTFHNAAVDARVAEHPASYLARWFTFDNATGESRSIGESSGTAGRVQAPGSLPSAQGTFIKVELSATGTSTNASWQKPVTVYFRQQGPGVWRLVGLDRLPDKAAATSSTN